MIRQGSGRMPGFATLGGETINALTDFLMTGKESGTVEADPNWQKYRTDGYNKFLAPDGLPAISPPWGTLNAIDLDKGEIRWKIPFGEIPSSGLKDTGSENYGGPVVTASGLLFIAATKHDKKFHVYDKLTGKLLFESTLPAAGNATPAVYETGGKQYVAVVCGGVRAGRQAVGVLWRSRFADAKAHIVDAARWDGLSCMSGSWRMGRRRASSSTPIPRSSAMRSRGQNRRAPEGAGARARRGGRALASRSFAFRVLLHGVVDDRADLGEHVVHRAAEARHAGNGGHGD